MTEQVYAEPLKSFATDLLPMPVFSVPVMEKGAAALQDINEVRHKCRRLDCVGQKVASGGRDWSRLRQQLLARHIPVQALVVDVTGSLKRSTWPDCINQGL